MQGLSQDLQLRQVQLQQPQQILRSELIQLPLLELEMRVQAELEENPFLEESADNEAEIESLEKTSENETTISESDEDFSPPTDSSTQEKKEVDWDDFLNDTDHWEFKASRRVKSEDIVDIPQPDVLSLNDHLYEQLHLDNLTPQEVIIGEEIIGNINRDGYLEVGLEEISLALDIDIVEVESLHQRLIRYDPIGIASRDLRECLLVQLQNLTTPAPVPERMVDEFWNDFINKRFENLADKLKISLQEVKESFEVIIHLNPKPGEGYFDERQNYVIPDLVINKVNDEFVVSLNDGDIPNFRISATYREMFLNRKGAEKKVRDFLSRKLESARWFINAIYQRRTTMLRTMYAIVERQKGFFAHGAGSLKPMILADIAEDIGKDISTISRVTNGKYCQTDWGVFELKYFFSERMTTDDGEDVSNRVIKQKLKEFIDEENKKKPFSDQQLTDLLNAAGFNIKRRTVAKYREQLRLPVKRLRREI